MHPRKNLESFSKQLPPSLTKSLREACTKSITPQEHRRPHRWLSMPRRRLTHRGQIELFTQKLRKVRESEGVRFTGPSRSLLHFTVPILIFWHGRVLCWVRYCLNYAICHANCPVLYVPALALQMGDTPMIDCPCSPSLKGRFERYIFH